jgi:hypothetical protein
MFCNKCGANIADGSSFCPSCGAQFGNAAAPKTPGLGMAIASMVLGIISLLCFPYITGVLAVIFGAVAKNNGYKSGMATAGIVCGIIGVALWLLMLLACSGTGLMSELMYELM